MRTPSAALMPSARLVIGLFGACAGSLSAHAELILGPNVELKADAAPGLGEAALETYRLPTELSVGAPKAKPPTSAETKHETAPEASPPAHPPPPPETAATRWPVVPDPRSETPRATRRMATDEMPRNGGDEFSSAHSLPEREGDLPRWNNEIGEEFKEMVRPLYEELATAGVIDALHGIKSYLEPHPTNTAAALDGAAPNDAPGQAELPFHRRYGGKDGESDAEMSVAQIEKERMVAALFIDEWIAAIKPWFFALIALLLLWRLVKFALQFVQWKTRRARRRAAKGRRGHRTSAA